MFLFTFLFAQTNTLNSSVLWPWLEFLQYYYMLSHLDIMEQSHAQAVMAAKLDNGFRYDEVLMVSRVIRCVQDYFRCEINICDVFTRNSTSSPTEISGQLTVEDNHILIPVRFDPSTKHDYGVIECKYQCFERQECIRLNVCKTWCQTKLKKIEVSIHHCKGTSI